jgi:hypothetical protein
MLNRKTEVKKAIIEYKLPKKKYLDLYNNFINGNCDSDNTIEKLIMTIKDKEYRFNTLTTMLKSRNLELKGDSVLC